MGQFPHQNEPMTFWYCFDVELVAAMSCLYSVCAVLPRLIICIGIQLNTLKMICKYQNVTLHVGDLSQKSIN